MIPNNVFINGLGRDGLTAVADINKDGKLDVIVVSALNFYTVIYIYSFLNNSYEIIALKEWFSYQTFGTLSIDWSIMIINYI